MTFWRVITRCKHFSDSNSSFSVVAVTGFSGHAYGSWKNRQSHRMWLKDFLPRDLPKNVRILTYGYNSSLLQEGRRGLLEFRRTFVKNLSTARNSLEVSFQNTKRSLINNNILGENKTSCYVGPQSGLHPDYTGKESP